MKNNETNNNVSVSENGAVMYKTTGTALLDLMWRTPSLRTLDQSKMDGISQILYSAYQENPTLFAKYLFYLRDVRGGMGERNSFRNIFLWLLANNNKAVELLKFVPEYGRWDDLVWLLCNTNSEKVKTEITFIIGNQLKMDLYPNDEQSKPSLLAKWLPSTNAGRKSKSDAVKLITWLNKCGFSYHEATYRKALSELRKKLKVVEINVAAKTYGDINYSAVPSVANTYYGKLFLKYDETRRRDYLESVFSGKKKINAGVVFPHDIYKNIKREKTEENDTYEAMWNNLPNMVEENSSTLVVRDGSGSMRSALLGSTTTSALDVSSALSIYFAERLNGEFHNKFITFSKNPQLVDFGDMVSICDKKNFLFHYNDFSNTDIEKVFKLVLSTAISKKIPQEEMPANILIISDMEFDCCAKSNDSILFEAIEKMYNRNGYELPRLIFWNVNSRTNSIPMTTNKNGVVLISGYSVNCCKMVLNGEFNPYDALVSVLSAERYNCIEL